MIKLLQYVFGFAPVKLSDIATYSKDRISSELMSARNYVGVDNLVADRGGITDSSHVPESGQLIAYSEGDLLIGNIRPYLKKIWCATHNGGTNGDVLVVRPDITMTVSRYLYHVLAADKFFVYDMRHAKGAKMPRGDKNAVIDYEFILPSLAEQVRIVEILDRFNALCNSISEGIPAEIEARCRQYEYYRDRLLAFTKQ